MASRVPILAPELLSRIFTHIDSKEDLKRIALSCKQFNALANPYLYERVDLVYEEDEDDVVNSFTFISLRALTILLLRKPELAKRVKHLSLRGTWTDEKCHGGLEQFESLQQPLEPEFAQALESLSQTQEEKEDWTKDIEYRGEELEEDAILAILLATLVNLKSLDFELWVRPEDFTIKILRTLKRVRNCEKPFDTTPVLSSVKDMLLSSWDNKEGISLAYVSEYITLPSLKNVYLHRIGSSADGDGEAGQLAVCKPGSLPIERIDMHDCRLDRVDLGFLIEAPKALRSFCYELGWGHLSYCDHSTTALLKALESQKETLEELWIYHVDGIMFNEERIEGKLAIPAGGFSQLTSLKHLKIAICFVFDEEDQENALENTLIRILPPNLETLTLEFWTHQDPTGTYHVYSNYKPKLCSIPNTVFKAVKALLDDSQVAFPSLKTVTLNVSREQVEKQKDRFTELLTVAQCAGVQFTVLARGDRADVEREWGFNEDVQWRTCESECNKRAPCPIFDLREE
ncbi:hypothetical protein MMC10_000698 [Thelotrema lepadinum]|nr:hypothetical protein [Thelotrema lepadinum]